MDRTLYFVRERNRVSGPYNLTQLERMFRNGQLARFHQVSVDGRSWTAAETLIDLLRAAPAAEPPVSAPATAPLASPSPAGLAPTAPSSGAGSSPPPPLVATRPRGWSLTHSVVLVGLVSVAAVATIVWIATRGGDAPDAAMKAARSKSQKHSARADADLLAAAPIKQVEADASSSRDLTAPPPQPASKPQSEPKEPPRPELAKPTEAPEPPRRENVNLPAAAISAQGHDGDVRAFDDLALPGPGPVTLALRGLDDPELEKVHLVVGPMEPGGQVSLVVQVDPQKGSNTRQPGRDPKDLGRFWVEGDRLRFQWAESPFKDSLIEPSRALRDCILEVRGANKGTLALALRAPLKDARPLKVSEGARHVGWGQEHERPSRPLAFGRCEVQVGEGWTELPSVTPHSRELVLLDAKADADAKARPPAKARGDELAARADRDEAPATIGRAKARGRTSTGRQVNGRDAAKSDVPADDEARSDDEFLGYEKLVLKLSLSGDGSILRVDLDPSAKVLDQGIGQAARNLKQLTARIEFLKKQQIPSLTREIQEATAIRAGLKTQIQVIGGTNPDGAAALFARANAQDEEVDRLGDLVKELKANLAKAESDATRATKVVAALTNMRKAAEPYLKAPLRVSLEYKIEGQTFEAARIGPE